MAAQSSDAAVLRHVHAYWDMKKGHSPIYDFLLPDVVISEASKGRVLARLPVVQNHVNYRGTVHGAVSASLVDWSGGMAISSHGVEQTGVSISIHIDYVGTARVGDTLVIEAVAHRVGRTMAFTTIVIRKQSDLSVIATASHTKMLSGPKLLVGGPTP